MTQSDFLGGATTEGATTAAFNSVFYLYDSLLSRSERGQSAGPAQFVDMCSCREIRLAAGEELHGYSRQNGLSKIALLVDRNAALSAVLNSKTIPAETSNRSWVTIGTFRRTGKITCAWCWWPPAIRSISAPRRGPWRISGSRACAWSSRTAWRSARRAPRWGPRRCCGRPKNFPGGRSRGGSLFEQYGPVERVDIVTDRDTGQPRGFGFDYAECAESNRRSESQGPRRPNVNG